MKPLLSYLNDFFSFQRVVGNDKQLQGLAKAECELQRLIQSKKVPGIAVSVLKNGKPYFKKGYGFADIENKITINPEKSVFRIASVSKPIAATALAKMVDEGIIDLDTTFYSYVPYYPKKEWDFTIRQLASHTAGIRGYMGKEYGLNEPYSIKESIGIFKDDALLFEPGTRYHYNSYDWVLISLAMQEDNGIPFEQYVKTKVLDPLGLENTFAASPTGMDVLENKNLQITTFYSKSSLGFRKAIPVNNFFKLAGGGYLSTAQDISNFGQAFLNKEVLNDSTQNQFLSSEIINNELTYYGLGWQVSQDAKGRPFYGHIGNGVGGYSNFFVYPKEKMVLSILINCTNPNVQEELDQVIDAFLSS